MMTTIFLDIAMAGVIVAFAILGYAALKPYARIEAFKAAYYLGRLRQHATDNKVNINEEVKNILMSEEKLVKSLNPAEEADSYVKMVDKAFSKKK